MCMNSRSANKPIRLVLFNKKQEPFVDESFSSIEMAKFFLGTVENEFQGGLITDRGEPVHSFTVESKTVS